MILLTQSYDPRDEQRADELKFVRQKNEGAGLFREVVYLDGSSKRVQYGDFLRYAAENFAGQPVVIANSDIVFDESAKAIPEMCRESRVIALTRWDCPSTPRMLGHGYGGMFFSGTQDVWCIVGGGMPDMRDEIPLGYVACEQAFLGWAVKNDCEVFNPAMDVRTWHVHANEDRPNRCNVLGYYAYPELTTVVGRGVVLCHQWPNKNGEFKTDWEIKQTCRG